jgi:imidazolonepropionase-like amidohydrolase
VVLRPSRILDGAGGVLTGREVVVRNGRIERIAPAGAQTGLPVYDLEGATLLPGLIDTHVHIVWHFDRETGRAHNGASRDSASHLLYAAENAWVTLRGGVTTVQSLGHAGDVPLRDAIAAGALPGPRILTSISPIINPSASPAQTRAKVDRMADAGADVIKVFASWRSAEGDTPNLSPDQIDAACERAAARGLRAVVHVHGSETARLVADAGCSQVEHGSLLDRQTLELLAERDVYFDPHTYLLLQNYNDNEEHFYGVGQYSPESFQRMREGASDWLEVFREALTVPGLRVVFGTDAVAGAHGRNWEELASRVHEGGQEPMDAIISATSLAAESLGLEAEIGRVEEGMVADLIATAGNPASDIDALSRVVFVMKGGTVVRNDPVGR